MKIYHNGRRINGRFDSFKSACKRGVRFLVRWGLVSAVAYSLFIVGGAVNSTHTVEAQLIEAPSPILERIADCESGNGKKGSASQYGKSGQVLMAVNTNGSIDIGKYQINNVHNTEATKLGYDLTTEEGNYGYAKYLYQNRGTGDWYSSAKCWQK